PGAALDRAGLRRRRAADPRRPNRSRVPHRRQVVLLHAGRDAGRAVIDLDRAGFDALLADHRVVPVVRELFLDAETPVGIYRRLAAGRTGSFLLESAQQGVWSRYSFVGVASFGQLTADRGRVVWRSEHLSEQRLLGDDAP